MKTRRGKERGCSSLFLRIMRMVPVVNRLTVDGVHFTGEGYQAMAGHIKTALRNEHPDAASLQKEP